MKKRKPKVREAPQKLCHVKGRSHRWIITFDDAVCMRCPAVGVLRNGNVEIRNQ